MSSPRTFYALGVEHTRASADVREPFASNWAEGRAAYRGLSLAPGSELVLLSTCYRTEGYLYGVEDDVRAVQQALARHAGRDWPEDNAFLYRDEEAVRHIFQVASGMKSVLMGEVQIYFQLKEAYAVAVEENCVDTTMHRLLHTAFRTAKRVINETELSRKSASAPVRAAELVQARIQNATRKEASASPSVLIVGAGGIGQEAGEALRMQGSVRLAFANRTEERARLAAKRQRAEHVPWQDRHAAAARSDAVIVATSAPEPVLQREAFALQARNKPLLLIDISMPRGADKEIGSLPDVELVNIDQLGPAKASARETLDASLWNAREIVDEMLSEYVAWVLLHQSLQPVIRTIADTFEAIRAQEVSKRRQRFSEENHEELDQLTRSIVQKLLAVPVVRLKSVDPERIDFAHGVRLLEHLFRRQDCDDETLAALNPSRSGAEDAPDDRLLQDMEREIREASRKPDTVRHAP